MTQGEGTNSKIQKEHFKGKRKPLAMWSMVKGSTQLIASSMVFMAE